MSDGLSLLAVLVLVFYFLPVIVGLMRGFRDQGVLVFLNLLLGWTLIGWLICLVWSMFGPVLTREALADRTAPAPWMNRRH